MMKIAYTGWTWLINHEDNYKWEFEQFLKEVSDLGYEAVENFAFITKYFGSTSQKDFFVTNVTSLPRAPYTQTTRS